MTVKCGIVLAAVFSAISVRAASTPLVQPNVLLIVSDDQGYGDFGCYGNDIIQTPNLDRLHSQSVRLENFYVNPVCAPTRAALMTGRYNYRTGVWDTWKGRMDMRSSELTLAEILRDHGYRTGIFGKWHLGENAPMRPQDQGFEDTFRWIDVSSRFNPGMELNGEFVRYEGFMDDLLFDHAIDFIEQNRNRPFFCYVPSFLPHDFPHKQVPDEELEPYRSVPGLTLGDLEAYAMVTRMDKNIGRLLTRLNELGLDESTLVIFMSDNGPQQRHGMDHGEETERYNCGLRGVKGTVYEGGIKVPCFVRWTGTLQKNIDVAPRTAVIDLLPTVLDFCRIPIPQGLTLDGVSLKSILFNSSAPLPERFLFNQFQRAAEPSLWENTSVLGEHFKLVNGAELYDLDADPAEANDISGQFPETVARFRQSGERWFSEITKEKGFTGGRVWLGSERQPEIRFKYWHQTDDKVFLAEVVSAGAYTVRVTDLQQEMLQQDSRFVISVDGKTIAEASVNPGDEEVVFQAVPLVAGPCDLKLVLENPALERKLGYGEADPGFRYVFISKMSDGNEVNRPL